MRNNREDIIDAERKMSSASLKRKARRRRNQETILNNRLQWKTGHINTIKLCVVCVVKMGRMWGHGCGKRHVVIVDLRKDVPQGRTT